MLIGLFGRAGAGKDVVGSMLVDYGYEKTSFASPLKDALCSMLNIDREMLEDRDYKESPLAVLGGKSPRYALQTLGTEWGRETVDQNIWVNLALNRIQDKENIVFSDVRFDSEAKAVIDNGGLIIEIVRPGQEAGTELLNHSSESGIDKCFIFDSIINDGTLEDLSLKVSKLQKTLENMAI